ncbi:MAG: hypothetical protein RQ842_04375 [Vulcanisaeta sp.]|nr:hypothetical protein [Vulcanisaeta sp.]
MGTDPVQSRVQETVSSSPEIYVKNPFLGFTPPLGVAPIIPVYVEVLKDGGRLIIRPTRDDAGANNVLRSLVGLDVAVFVPSMGLTWTSKASYRRGQGYVYIRIPANLRKYFISIWKSGVAIPVLISVPPVSLTMGAPGVVGYGR